MLEITDVILLVCDEDLHDLLPEKLKKKQSFKISFKLEPQHLGKQQHLTETSMTRMFLLVF